MDGGKLGVPSFTPVNFVSRILDLPPPAPAEFKRGLAPGRRSLHPCLFLACASASFQNPRSFFLRR